MMRRITRYVVSEFLAVFTGTLLVTTCILVLVFVGMDAVRSGLSLLSVARLMPYALPIALLYAIPGATLFAACSVYGRMSAANEVVAIKSLGISPLVLLWPVFTLAFALSIGVVWLNDVAVSWGRVGIQRVIQQSLEQIVYGMLETQRSYSDKRFSINVKGVAGKKLLRPWLTVTLSDNQPPMVFTAEEAVLHWEPGHNNLRISLTNGDADFGDGRRMVFPETEHFDMPLWNGTENEFGDRPADTAMRRIPEAAANQMVTIHGKEKALATEAAYQMLTGEFGALLDQRWQGLHNDLQDSRSRLHRLHTEPWRRWANGFSCLAFVMVGAPLAIRLRSSDVWTSFAACFLPVLIVYYPMLAYGVQLAKSGDLPPYCVWLGNLVFLGFGLLLIRSMLRR